MSPSAERAEGLKGIGVQTRAHRVVHSDMCEHYRKGAEEAIGVQCEAKAAKSSSRKRDSVALKLITWHSTIERTSLLRFYQTLFQSWCQGVWVCPRQV